MVKAIKMAAQIIMENIKIGVPCPFIKSIVLGRLEKLIYSILNETNMGKDIASNALIMLITLFCFWG
jgi:hypothetical protein